MRPLMVPEAPGPASETSGEGLALASAMLLLGSAGSCSGTMMTSTLYLKARSPGGMTVELFGSM